MKKPSLVFPTWFTARPKVLRQQDWLQAQYTTTTVPIDCEHTAFELSHNKENVFGASIKSFSENKCLTDISISTVL